MDYVYKVALHIDSNYAYHVAGYLAHGLLPDEKITINWKRFLSYLTGYIGDILRSENVVIPEKFYYTGSFVSADMARQAYFHELESAGINRVSFPLRSANAGQGLKEDAVDTTLVFNATKNFYSVPKDDRIDFLVLFAGDSDFVPLINGLKQEGVKTIVVYYDFVNGDTITKAAQNLLETADHVINMESLVKDRVNEEVKAIFERSPKDFSSKDFSSRDFGSWESLGTDYRTVGGSYQNQSRPQGYTQEEHTPKKIVHRTPIMTAPRTITFRRRTLPFDESVYYYGEVTESMLINAINACKQDEEGYALVAEVGKALEDILGKKLPGNRKLKTIITGFGPRFETKDAPAFSVRVQEN